MTPKEQLQKINAEMTRLRTKATDRPAQFTDDDADRATELAAKHARLKDQMQKQEDAAKVMKDLSGWVSDEQPEMPGENDGIGFHPSGRSGANGPALEKAAPFGKHIIKAFNAAGSVVGGPGSGKQLADSGRITASIPTSTSEGWGSISDEAGVSSMVGLPRTGLSLLEIIQAEEVTGGPVGSYLRQQQRENRATTVPGGRQKPTSSYQLKPAQWRTSTIAHLSEPIRTQWLDDYAGLYDFIGSELVHGVDRATNRFMLYGGQDEDAGTQPGLLNVGGVETTEYRESKLRTLRAAIGELEVAGVEPTHIVMSPADWEDIEVLEDAAARYLFDGTPGSRPRRQLWGLPVVTPPDMEQGRAMVGTFGNVRLLHRGSHQITWNDSLHVENSDSSSPLDLYGRNMVRFRDEVRVSLVIQSLQAYRYVLVDEDHDGNAPQIPTDYPAGNGEDDHIVPIPPRPNNGSDGNGDD